MPSQNTLGEHMAPTLREALRRFASGAAIGTSGIAAVEFSFIAPPILLMMIATADFGMGFYRKMQVQDAAQAGAQYAAAHGFDSTSISTAVTSATAPSAKDSWEIKASPAPSQFCGCSASTGVTANSDTAPFCTSRCPDGTVAGTYVTVSAQGTYKTIIPYTVIKPYLVIPESFAFAAQTTVRIQ